MKGRKREESARSRNDKTRGEKTAAATQLEIKADMKKKLSENMSVFSACLHLSEWESMCPLESISI